MLPAEPAESEERTVLTLGLVLLELLEPGSGSGSGEGEGEGEGEEEEEEGGNMELDSSREELGVRGGIGELS